MSRGLGKTSRRPYPEPITNPATLQLLGWIGVTITFALWATTGKAEPLFIIPCWALATGGKLGSAIAELKTDA